MRKRKKKKHMTIIILLAVIIGIAAALAAATGIYYMLHVPTVTFDASKLTGEVTSGASGYLYRLSENGVPSWNMTESLKVSSVSAKVKNGLQHPIGEVSHVAPQLIRNESFDYMIVYLQDVYKTWYYDHENITEQKKNGTYDYKDYLQNTFFPAIKDSIKEMLESEYADKLVFCIFNECDNGVWFGRWDSENENHLFNTEDFDTFNEAWKMTYDYVKSLAPNTFIGGPGNLNYRHNKMDSFLKFASENNCVPDVMIYHELSDDSIYNWGANVKDLKKIEKKYGISTETPIIVTEYGRMEDNGNANIMLRYITKIENSKTYANQAFWLLANNLCNTCADYNTPNSAWWVYRWYAALEGQTMDVKVSDFFHCDFENAIKKMHSFRTKNFLGLGALSDSKDKIQMLVTGADYKGKVKLKNLDSTALFNKAVKVTVSQITYQGISGKVYAPEIVKTYTESCGKKLEFDMGDMNSDTAYKIELEVCEKEEEPYENENLYKRYEFENGVFLGDAYTYDSAYATTGNKNGMAGGFEKEGDGVELSFDVPESAEYEIRLIYGNSNDGSVPDDRTFSSAAFTLDGKEEILSFENTIKSEITNVYFMTKKLSEGSHTVRFAHNTGTFVLDSMLIRIAENTKVYFEKNTERENSFLIVSPNDGYYEIKTKKQTTLSVDGAKAKTDQNGNAVIYLRRGLNYLDISSDTALLSVKESSAKGNSISLDFAEAKLTDGAKIKVNETLNIEYLSGISSKGGKAQYVINAPEEGTYKLTVLYSNNLENGVHDYNIDLVEGYITIAVNGFKQENLYCRNTYSNDNFTTVTTNIELKKGKNLISFSNDGENKFNGNDTFAPNIAKISIYPVTA